MNVVSAREVRQTRRTVFRINGLLPSFMEKDNVVITQNSANNAWNLNLNDGNMNNNWKFNQNRVRPVSALIKKTYSVKYK